VRNPLFEHFLNGAIGNYVQGFNREFQESPVSHKGRVLPSSTPAMPY
jgi:hypothetical protein